MSDYTLAFSSSPAAAAVLTSLKPGQRSERVHLQRNMSILNCETKIAKDQAITADPSRELHDMGEAGKKKNISK